MKISVYDRSHRGLLELRGADRQRFLQGMVSNDVSVLRPGHGCHATLLDSTGHILADIRIHAFPDFFLLETDPSCLPVLSATLDKLLIMEDVQLADVTTQWVTLTVLGEGKLPLLDLHGEVRPIAYSLAPGWDLWISPNDRASALNRLISAGAVLLDDEGWETLRVEAGLPAWGRELTPAVLLPEAGIEDAISYSKGCYVGQEIVARLHARGHANRGLRHLLLDADAPVPPTGATIHVPEDGPEPGREIGRVTSAVASPKWGGRSLALGYVRKEYWADGTLVTIQILQPGGLVFSYGAVVQEISPLLSN
jgi:folate-binding protein YgfZ